MLAHLLRGPLRCVCWGWWWGIFGWRTRQPLPPGLARCASWGVIAALAEPTPRPGSPALGGDCACPPPTGWPTSSTTPTQRILSQARRLTKCQHTLCHDNYTHRSISSALAAALLVSQSPQSRNDPKHETSPHLTHSHRPRPTSRPSAVLIRPQRPTFGASLGDKNICNCRC